MDTYVILRRTGWRSPEELQEAAGRSRKVGDEEMSDDIRWIRSYVLEEDGGSVGTVCIYQASSPEAIRRHAEKADLPDPFGPTTTATPGSRRTSTGSGNDLKPRSLIARRYTRAKTLAGAADSIACDADLGGSRRCGCAYSSTAIASSCSRVIWPTISG